MTQAQQTPPQTPRRLAIIIGLVVAVVLFVPGLAEFFLDKKWFESLGFGSVFATSVKIQLVLGVVSGLLMGAWIYLHGRLALKLTPNVPKAFPGQKWDYTFLHTLADRVPLIAAVIVGALSGLSISGKWETVLAYMNAVDFGSQDALFGHDIGFFVFTLPALLGLHQLLLFAFGAALVMALAVYNLRGAVHTFTGKLFIAGPARKHLFVIAAGVFGVFAFGSWLASRELVFSTTGPLAGASYADVHATLPALRVEMAVAALGAVLMGVASAKKGWTFPVAAVALLAATHFLGVVAYPSALHRFSVLPNEAEREAPFIDRNIEATRAAFGLDNVREMDLETEVQLTWDDIEANQATIRNVRLWDHRPLLDTFAQIQEIRTYYEFASVDNDRYMIDGELRQTMLSARELASSSLPNRTWINEHFTFTHGYGLTLGPVNSATEEGLPELFIRDIPPVSTQEDIQVTQPAIYFGELTSSHIFVNTSAREFDHPQGDDNAYTEYEGADGISLDSFFSRLILATHLRNFKILLSDDVGDESRVLLHREIMERVRRIAPFLDFDEDPYLVVRDDGRLTWIVDAYTTSDSYPYAQRIGGRLNYIRNSVKVTVDAYEGTTTFFVNDEADPVVRMWRSAFPDLFESMDSMDEDLVAHLRYPEDLFRIQTEIFSVYHMGRAEDVYNREDQWDIPSLTSGGTAARMEPYYTVMRLPGEETEEFILMLPYTPQSKQNLAAWMVARSDGENRGELVVYRFPKRRLVFGPEQIMSRINQDAEISRQVSLWDQRGSQAIFGTLLVIPIGESLIYVAPLYLRSDGGRIPELKRIIAVYDNSIAMEGTLDEALASIFNARDEGPSAEVATAALAADAEGETEGEVESQDSAALVEAGDTPPNADVRLEAQRLFEVATQARREGNWTEYGAAIDALGETLESLAAAARQEGRTEPSPAAPEQAPTGEASSDSAEEK